MAKHATPRTRSPFWTIITGTVVIATSFGAGAGLQAATDATQPEPQVRTLPKGSVEVGDGSTAACWVEKVQSAATAEVICGDRGDRPRTDTADIGEVFATNDDPCGYVASWAWRQGFAIEPAGCN